MIVRSRNVGGVALLLGVAVGCGTSQEGGAGSGGIPALPSSGSGGGGVGASGGGSSSSGTSVGAGTPGNAAGTSSVAGTPSTAGASGSAGLSGGSAAAGALGGGAGTGAGGAPACTSAKIDDTSIPFVKNGDFTTGASGWSAFGPSVLTTVQDPARSGSALQVASRSDTWNGAAVSIAATATSGQMLLISGWVRVDVATAPVNFSLKTTVNGVDAYATIASGTATNTGWTLLTGSIALSWAAPPTAADVYVQGPPGGVIVYLDDVSGVLQAPVGGSGTGNADGSVAVQANVALQHQTLEGFGASLAWYQDLLLNHAKAAELYPVLFADLGLDILRLRNRHQRSTEAVDLSTEATLLAKATESLGQPPKVLMTSWSPPAALKASGKEDCTNDTTTCTLAKSGGQYAYAEFANWWNESLDVYAAKGISPDFVSIQNETDFIPNGWEGCRFDPTEGAVYAGYDKALAAVAEKLRQRAKPPKLIGPETLGVHWDRVQKYAAALDATLLYGWSHHLYEKGSGPTWLWQDVGPDAFVAPIYGALQVERGKPIFMTEFQTDEDTLNTGGFETGWLIHNSLAEGNASAWLYWNLAWDKSGLVALDGANYVIRDQYYALRHYAKFTNPGDTRVGVSSNLPAIRATGWLAADQRRLTFVLLNVGTAAKTVRLTSCGFPFNKASAVRTVFRTDGSSERWQPVAALEAGSIELPSRSMATVVLEP